MSEGKQCDVCEVREATYKSKLLGSDDAICHTCFCLWYECGVTNKAEMKKLSLEEYQGPAQ